MMTLRRSLACLFVVSLLAVVGATATSAQNNSKQTGLVNVSLGDVDQLIGQAFKSVGQWYTLRQLDFSRLSHTPAADQFDNLCYDTDELIILQPDLAEQLCFIFGDEFESIEVISELAELP